MLTLAMVVKVCALRFPHDSLFTSPQYRRVEHGILLFFRRRCDRSRLENRELKYYFEEERKLCTKAPSIGLQKKKKKLEQNMYYHTFDSRRAAAFDE